MFSTILWLLHYPVIPKHLRFDVYPVPPLQFRIYIVSVLQNHLYRLDLFCIYHSASKLAFFLISWQIVLFPTSTCSSFNIDDALIELKLNEVFNIRVSNRLVFRPLGSTNSKDSENVLCWHSGLLQNIFLVFTRRIVWRSCIGISSMLRI